MHRRTVLTAVPLVALSACADGETSPSPSDDATGYRLEALAEDLWAPRAVQRVDDDRLLLPDQGGTVHVHEDGTLRSTPFLDLTDGLSVPSKAVPELGLAGLALAPDFADSGRCYVMRTLEPGSKDGADAVRVDVLSAFTADPDTLVADVDSEEVLLRLPRDFADHVGGGVVVDDDGLLHVALGAVDGAKEAQDPRSWDGTILRISPDDPGGYTIPRDNPFASSGGRKEVWSYGYRNPFRLHWDSDIGLIVAHPLWHGGDQQVVLATEGANAGYPTVQEAGVRTCWTKGKVDPGCTTQAGRDLTPPVAEYPPDVGDIVSGAIIYRGTSLPDLTGKAVVADWAGTLLAGTPTGEHWTLSTLDLHGGATGRLWDLSTDGSDVYVHHTGFTEGSGSVHRLVAR